MSNALQSIWSTTVSLSSGFSYQADDMTLPPTTLHIFLALYLYLQQPAKTSPPHDIWQASAASVGPAERSTTSRNMEAGGRKEVIDSAIRKASELNPDSQVFRPFGSPVRTVLDLSSLSITGSDRSSSPARSSVASYRTPSLSPHKAAARLLPSGPLSTSTTLRTPGTSYEWSPLDDKDARRVSPGHSPRTPPGALLFQSKDESSPSSMVQIPTQASKQEDQTTELHVGRYLAISGIPPDVTAEEIRSALNTLAEFKSIVIKHYKLSGLIFVAFYDPREALKVFLTLRDKSVAFRPGGNIIRLSCTDVAREVVEQAVMAEVNTSILREDSEPCVEVEVCGSHGIAKAGMKECLRRIGDLRWVQSIGQDGRRFIAEFWDTRDTAQAVLQLNKLREDPKAGELQISAFLKSSSARPLASASTPVYTLGSAAWNTSAPRSFTKTASAPLESTGFSTYAHTSTPYRALPSSVPRWSLAYKPQTPSSDDRMFNRSASNAYMANNWRSGGASTLGYESTFMPASGREVPPANVVWPERIMSGLDGRTTVMVKDVPNKLTRDGLVDVLNSIVSRQFDFVYLRFDFKNQCNVGYAFVNFTSVRALYEFYDAKVGRKWNMFSSDKVLQVCYANIQGKTALINKFRNSAVMDVLEPWRPQIFYSSGALKGQPEPFPTSDNIDQKSRSNALRLNSLDHDHPNYEHSDVPYNYDRTPAGYTV